MISDLEIVTWICHCIQIISKQGHCLHKVDTILLLTDHNCFETAIKSEFDSTIC